MNRARVRVAVVAAASAALLVPALTSFAMPGPIGAAAKSAPTRNLLEGATASLAGTGAWAPWNSTLTTRVVDGQPALAITSSAAGLAGATVGTGPSSWLPAVAGQVYEGTARAQTALPGGQLTGYLAFFSASGSVLAQLAAQPSPDQSTSWKGMYPVVGVAPAGAAYVRFGVGWQAAAAGETQYLTAPALYAYPGGSPPVVGPLRTEGNRILDGNGNPVVFHGLTLYGLEAAPDPAIPDSEVAAAKEWGANFIRVPLGEQLWLSSSCSYDPSYESKVDAAVQSITSRGMVAMLDLHFNTITACGTGAPQMMADAPNALTFWSQVGARYQNNPLVAFELYNEPHDISDAVWLDGGTVTTPTGTTFQAAGMQQMYDAVRSTGAQNLVFVSGTHWANDWPSTAPISGTNVVYGVHAYTCPGLPPPNCAAATPYDPSSILDPWVTPGQSYPVMVTEFGWPAKNDGRYLNNVVSYANGQGWGWSVFAWDGTTAGQFDLASSILSDGTVEPDPTGMPVLLAMQEADLG
jgi:endoglucanase